MDAGILPTVSRPPDFQRAFWTVDTSTITTSPFTPYAMRLVLLLDSASFLVTSCFNTLCVGAALVW